MTMIIEQNGIAYELDNAPFRVYGTKDELKNLAAQSLEAARKVEIGWVELDPQDKNHKVVTKPQTVTSNKWVSEGGKV
jgi:hypothetical protein